MNCSAGRVLFSRPGITMLLLFHKGRIMKSNRAWMAPAALLALLFSTSLVFAKGKCGPGDHTESGLQGETSLQERFSGDSQRAYNCNLELMGQYRGEGAKSQGGPAYSRNCAYYVTDGKPEQRNPGVVVVDASDPRNPQATAFLNDFVMV